MIKHILATLLLATTAQAQPSPECDPMPEWQAGAYEVELGQPLRFCTPPAKYDEAVFPHVWPYKRLVLQFHGKSFSIDIMGSMQLVEIDPCDIVNGIECEAGLDYQAEVYMREAHWTKPSNPISKGGREGKHHKFVVTFHHPKPTAPNQAGPPVLLP